MISHLLKLFRRLPWIREAIPHHTAANSHLDVSVEAPTGVRKLSGVTVPAILLPDGPNEELMKLACLSKLQRIRASSAIADALAIVRAKIIIASEESIFTPSANCRGANTALASPGHQAGRHGCVLQDRQLAVLYSLHKDLIPESEQLSSALQKFDGEAS